MDDFVATANTKENLMPQIESDAPSLKLEWAPKDGLEKLRRVVTEFKQNETGAKVLVIEGIFLFHPDVLDDIWDKRIYLNCDEEQADLRRIKREKERWGEKYFPEDHPDSFARLFKIAYIKYREFYHPKQRADLVVNIK